MSVLCMDINNRLLPTFPLHYVWKTWLYHSILLATDEPLSDGIVWLVRSYYRTAVEKWVVGAERRQDGESYLQF